MGEQKQSGDEVAEGGKKAPTEVRGARKQNSLRTVLKHAFKSCRDLHRRPRTSTATGKRPLSSSPPPQSSPSSSLCVCAIECASAALSISPCSTTTTRLTA